MKNYLLWEKNNQLWKILVVECFFFDKENKRLTIKNVKYNLYFKKQKIKINDKNSLN